MNPKYLLFALLGIFLALVSCDQSEDDEFSDASPRIRTMTVHNVEGITQIYSFEYDAMGRIVKKTYMPAWREKYSYLSDTMIVIEKYSNETLAYTDTLWLNDLGLVITKKNKMSPLWGNVTATYAFTTTYEYNPEGYLVKSSEGNATCEIQDGNTVKIMYSSYSGTHPGFFTVSDSSSLQVTHTFIYQFSPNTINTIGNENMGMPFFGKQDKNLILAYEFLFSKPLGAPGEGEPLYGNRNTYSYSYDARNRVTKRTATTTVTQAYETYTYYN